MGYTVSAVNLELKDLEEMILFGKFIEASEWFKKNKDLLSSNQNEDIGYKIVYCNTMIGLKKAQQVLPMLDDIIEKTTKENITGELLLTIHAKSQALDVLAKYKESLKEAEKGLRILNRLPYAERGEFQLQKAHLLGQKAAEHFQIEEYKKALFFCKKSLKAYEHLNNTFGVALSLTLRGLLQMVGKNFTKALEFLNESLALFEALNNEYQSAIIYHYLGRVYRTKGEPNKALQYIMKSLPIVLKFGDDYRIMATLFHLLPILIERGEFDKAEKYSKQCLALAENTNFFVIIGLIRYRLLRIALYQGNSKEAKNQLEILYSLREKYSNPIYYLEHYLLSEALILKSSKQINDLAKAEEILRNLINSTPTNSELCFESMYYLCELLLQQYQTTNNPEVLSEINLLSKRVLDFGSKEALAGFRIKAYHIRLLSMFVQEQNQEGTIDFLEIEFLLKETQELAERLGLNSTLKQFSQQYFELLNQQQIWSAFMEKYY